MKKAIFTVIMIVVMALGFSGCGNPNTDKTTDVPKTDVSIIIGNHDNAMAYNTGAVREAVAMACRTAGTVNIIVSDGDPYVAAEIKIPQLKKGITNSKAEQIINEQTNQIVSLLNSDSAKAKTPEVDTLQALDIASRNLIAADCENKVLVVMDTGVQTTGSLNLTGTLLDTVDINKVVETLSENKNIPNLKTVNLICWEGLSYVGGEQNKLTNKEAQILESLWMAILSESGASEIEFCPDMPIGEISLTGLPPVTTIPVMEDASAIVAYEPSNTIELNEETLNFQPGSDELITDESEVKSVLTSIVDYLKENPSSKLLLAGTTASAGTESELKDLSLRRVKTVKAIMLSMGVKDEQIEVIGTGTNNPFYINDKNADGSLNSEIAKINRSVIICGYESDMAKTILNF